MIGKVAVAHVVLNRLRNPGWWSRHKDSIPDDTVAAVCRDPYQFSCWNETDPNRARIIKATPPDLAEEAKAVAYVLSGMWSDPTHGATHYRVIGHPAKWAEGLKPVVTIGKHEFFSEVP